MMFVACDAKWVSIKECQHNILHFCGMITRTFLGICFSFLPISGVSDFARHIRLVYICLLLNELSLCENVANNKLLANWRLSNIRNANNEQTWRNMWRHRSFCASGCPAILLMKPARLDYYDNHDDWYMRGNYNYDYDEKVIMIIMKRWLWWWWWLWRWRWWWWCLLIKPSRPARRSSMKSSSNMPWITIMSILIQMQMIYSINKKIKR